MIIPCNVQGFKKSVVGDHCVFKTYQKLVYGRNLAYRYGLLVKTLDTSNTTPGYPYGFELVYRPSVIRYFNSGKTKFDPATIERMHKVLKDIEKK